MWRKWVDTKRRAHARKGVPIGAGKFGLVASRPSPGTVPGDLDLDGIPDPLDIDDDGNLVLDNFQQSNPARAAQLAPGGLRGLHSILQLALEDTVNANAGAPSLQDLDARLATWGVLQIQYPLDRETELDCTGLTYCSPGGSGIVAYAGSPGRRPPPVRPSRPAATLTATASAR